MGPHQRCKTQSKTGSEAIRRRGTGSIMVGCRREVTLSRERLERQEGGRVFAMAKRSVVVKSEFRTLVRDLDSYFWVQEDVKLNGLVLTDFNSILYFQDSVSITHEAAVDRSSFKPTMSDMDANNHSNQTMSDMDANEQSNQNEEHGTPSSQQEEEIIKNKYGGIVPKKPPLLSKDNERAYFDSADWALGKQGGDAQKPKGPLEALRPKLQPTPQQQVRSRSAYASNNNEDSMRKGAFVFGMRGGHLALNGSEDLIITQTASAR
ncbi:hypothetical protein Cni_G19751 [Canna indica]|uniref:cAMP-regulated phosphoprotein 19-related protein n=1 Tax=Canna indica TaxID=4628 RepID=A0AAQ3KLW2_9LILI|nr:hypothetical protein Cni_G19751 [Canna indica]